MIESQRVNVATTAVALNGAESDSVSGAVLVVKAVAAVDLGGSGVMTGAGYALGAGESVTVELPAGQVLYAVAATSAEVQVLRVGV